MLSCISNITIDGADLILDRVFDNVGFNRIGDDIFRRLVKAQSLISGKSKAATVEYLKNHFDEDISLSKIYRYLGKLSDSQHQVVQDISVEHTRKILGGNIGCCSMMSQRCILKRITGMICARQVSQRGTAQEPSDNTWSAGQHRLATRWLTAFTRAINTRDTPRSFRWLQSLCANTSDKLHRGG